MRRVLQWAGAAALLTLLVSPVAGARFDGLKITWLGHAGFKIVSPKGTVVLIDPWLDHPKAPKGVDLSKVDLILITHGHFDHIGNTVEIAKRTGATVVAIFEVSVYLQQQGLKNVVGMNKGGTYEFKGIKVHMVEASHSSGIGTERIIPGGEAAGYIVEFENGVKIYHMGDTGFSGTFSITADYYKPDVIMIPIGDHFTLGPREAAYVVNHYFQGARWYIPMHYGTFPILKGTPEAFQAALAPELRDRVLVLKPGETVE